jgi:PAS domain S-box-containing protein
MDLDALLNNLLSSGIEATDPGVTKKVKILNSFHLVFIMMAPLLGLFYFYIGAIFLFYVFIIAGVLMISSLILLRKTLNITVAGNCAIFILWATLFMMTWYTGPFTPQGVIKPPLMMNGGLILLSMFFLGYLWGAAWTILVFVETGVIVYLFLIQYPFPNLIPAEISEIYILGTYLFALLILFVFAFLYEKGKREISTPGRKKPPTLKESKSYLDGVLEGFPIPAFILNRNHRVTQWNNACRQLTGVRPEEILGRRVWEGFQIRKGGSIADIILEDPSFLAENYRDSIKSISGKGWFELEIFFPKLNGGQQTIVNAAQILDNKGNLSGAIQTIQEFSGPVLGKGPMDSGSTVLSDESFGDPVFRTDLQGLICFWNRACEEQYGYSSSQMMGQSPEPLISKEHKTNFNKTIMDVSNGANFTNKEWKYHTHDGKEIYVLAKAYPLQSSDKMRKECVIVSRDITDLKMKQKRVERYAAESKEKMKKLTEEYDLVKKNIASFIRKKNDSKPSS